MSRPTTGAIAAIQGARSARTSTPARRARRSQHLMVEPRLEPVFARLAAEVGASWLGIRATTPRVLGATEPTPHDIVTTEVAS